MTDFDDEPTAEEQAEAEALARALEHGGPAEGAGGAPPADALGAAALLRHAARAPTAAADRQARLAAAAARVRLPAAARPARRWRWQWLVPAALVPAAAALLLVVGTTTRRMAAPGAALPVPDVALLEAQARAARGGPGMTSVTALAALDREMRGYRARFYQHLAAHGRGEEQEAP